jgi:hypothetical protein
MISDRNVDQNAEAGRNVTPARTMKDRSTLEALEALVPLIGRFGNLDLQEIDLI